MALHRIVGFALTSRDGGLLDRTSVAQIGLAAALAVGMTCASAAVARAGDYDDPSGASFGSQMLKAIGLPDPDHPEYEINYSERSPLVVPPNRNLPAPIAGDKPPTPNWPQDPDIKKRQASKKEPVHVEGDRVMDEGRPLRPDELIPKGNGASAASSSPGIEPKGQTSAFELRLVQKGRIWNVHRRASAGQPDRSTAGLPNAIPGSTIWNSAGSQASEGVHPRRAHGDTAITCAVSLAPR
jgi:hypothetical protein